MKKQLLTLVIASGLLACSQTNDVSKPSAEKKAKAAVNQASTPPIKNRQTSQNPGHSGAVLTKTDAGGYTYLEVKNQNGVFWLASNNVKVQEGDQVSWGGYAVMQNFHSKGLNKTFKKILFVSKVARGNGTNQVQKNTANQGIVKTVTPAAGYNYIEVNVSGNSQWLAAPVSPVTIGSTISWRGASPMKNFHSKSLGRDFESILFVGGISTLQGG